MTSIQSSVTRRGRFDFARYGQDKKPIVITLRPNGSQNDLVSVRLLGRRSAFDIDLIDLYAMLVRQSVMHARMAKIRKRRKSVKRFIRLTA